MTREQDSSTLDRRHYVENRIRSNNENIFKENQIEKIHRAIATNKKIDFQYLKYNLKKEKVPSREKDNGFYKVSPYALVWSDTNLYLVGFVGRRRINFRVDRMDYINILDENRSAEKEMEALNLENYSAKLFSMFTGTLQRVQIKFTNELINVAIDRFGIDVRIMADGENHFIAFVELETSPQFFGWLCGMGKAVEIVSPAAVVKKFAEYIAEIANMYSSDKKD